MSNTKLFNSEEILGYKVIERIGSGGYGEVWRAEAPGGLQKALKVLYGFHDERRAPGRTQGSWIASNNCDIRFCFLWNVLTSSMIS
ncbi:MAG: hypothetical protein R3C03_22330 [Pirellulaceae bacterium]